MKIDPVQLEQVIQDAIDCFEGDKKDFAGYMTDCLMQYFNDKPTRPDWVKTMYEGDGIK